jgi:hypothetical protein
MGRVQASLVNPLVRIAFRLGIPDPGDALLETTVRRTGKPRLTPVCDGLEGDTFWLISERVSASSRAVAGRPHGERERRSSSRATTRTNGGESSAAAGRGAGSA